MLLLLQKLMLIKDVIEFCVYLKNDHEAHMRAHLNISVRVEAEKNSKNTSKKGSMWCRHSQAFLFLFLSWKFKIFVSFVLAHAPTTKNTFGIEIKFL